MIAFIDTSVLLRKLFGEPNSLMEWSQIRQAYASRMLLLEVGRVIDRKRLAGQIDDRQVVQLLRETKRIALSIEILALSERILVRASGPMPTTLGSLDAIHLATALELAQSGINELSFVTHDVQLGRAALAYSLEVFGIGQL